MVRDVSAGARDIWLSISAMTRKGTLRMASCAITDLVTERHSAALQFGSRGRDLRERQWCVGGRGDHRDPAASEARLVEERRHPLRTKSPARAEIWSVSDDGRGQPTKLVDMPAATATAKFSPDGRWIAYSSGNYTRGQTYVLSYPGGQQRQVSIDDGGMPRWSRDGKRIFFVSQQQLVAVSFDAQEFSTRAQRSLFKVRVAGGIRDPYDVLPDGEHFLMQDATDQDEPITLLVNWPLLLQGQRP